MADDMWLCVQGFTLITVGTIFLISGIMGFLYVWSWLWNDWSDLHMWIGVMVLALMVLMAVFYKETGYIFNSAVMRVRPVVAPAATRGRDVLFKLFYHCRPQQRTYSQVDAEPQRPFRENPFLYDVHRETALPTIPHGLDDHDMKADRPEDCEECNEDCRSCTSSCEGEGEDLPPPRTPQSWHSTV